MNLNFISIGTGLAGGEGREFKFWNRDLLGPALSALATSSEGSDSLANPEQLQGYQKLDLHHFNFSNFEKGVEVKERVLCVYVCVCVLQRNGLLLFLTCSHSKSTGGWGVGWSCLLTKLPLTLIILALFPSELGELCLPYAGFEWEASA